MEWVLLVVLAGAALILYAESGEAAGYAPLSAASPIDWTADVAAWLATQDLATSLGPKPELAGPLDWTDWLGTGWQWGADPTRISDPAFSLIKSLEGLRLTSYEDPPGSGKYSIGYGHGGVLPGQSITAAQAELYLGEDVAGAESAVGRLVTVPLTQGQYDALVSFVFNIGAGAFGSSTLLRKLNQGDYAGAAAEFSRWVYAGGKVNAGLVARRSQEQAWFSSP